MSGAFFSGGSRFENRFMTRYQPYLDVAPENQVLRQASVSCDGTVTLDCETGFSKLRAWWACQFSRSRRRRSLLRSCWKCRDVVRTDIDFCPALHKLPTTFTEHPVAQMKSHWIGRLLVTGLLMLPARSATSADWPAFRGPNASGIADTTGLPTEFGPKLNVVWQTALPARRVVTCRYCTTHLPHGRRRKKARNAVPRSIQRQDSVAKIRHSLPL